MTGTPEAPRSRDHRQRPQGFLVSWGIPILIILSLNIFRNHIPPAAVIFILAAAFAWMGTACLINARRCGRRHCYLSGPVLLAGALAILLVGYRIVPSVPQALNYIVWLTLGLVALTFIPEWIWGRYVHSNRH